MPTSPAREPILPVTNPARLTARREVAAAAAESRAEASRLRTDMTASAFAQSETEEESPAMADGETETEGLPADVNNSTFPDGYWKERLTACKGPGSPLAVDYCSLDPRH